MRLVVKKQNIGLVLTMRERAKLFADGRWRTEAFRGVVDAGRRTKTQVQRSAFKQMAMKRYGFVAQNTRGTPRQAQLAFEIYALKGGQRIEEYAGLRVLSKRGNAARGFNVDRDVSDKGFVRSGVWNAPRTFKRSFGSNGGFFAMLPGGTKTHAPKALWTYGLKPDQPRDGTGRFASPGRKYGKIRRLFGGALRKEIGKDQALATFYRVGPVLLRQKVEKRLGRFLKI